MLFTKEQKEKVTSWTNAEQREKVINYVKYTWDMNAFSRDDLQMIALELLRQTIEERGE